MRRAGALRAAAFAARLLAGCLLAAGTQAGTPCAEGLWATAMLGSWHLNPDRHFEDFNPGIGVECNFRPEWTAAAGYFRNSLLRPSFYGGAIYAPESLHWGAMRLGAMGGVISGYNYGRFGVGENHRTGLILTPSLILERGRFGANLILVPPIPADHLPLTLGLQARFRIR
jgi:hypothetical protein